MTFHAIKSGVFDHGVPPDKFLVEFLDWGKIAAEEIFAPNPSLNDLYVKIKPELGPWEDAIHRRGALLHALTVLAGFESDWDHTEGIDTSRLGDDTPENSEAGAWQVSYDARGTAPGLITLLQSKDIKNGIQFQRAMKFDHRLSMEFIARLVRYNTLHNGPLYKGDERLKIRKTLRGPEHSIYPWLRRAAVAEWRTLLS